MSTKAAQYSEMTIKASDECDICTNVDLCGSVPTIPTICISDASEHDDVISQNERPKSFANLNSNSKVKDKNPQVEKAESIISLDFEGSKLYLRLPKFENNLDLSAITTDESITTPPGSSLSPDIKYLPLDEDDDDSSSYFEKSISGENTVLESPEIHSVVKGQKETCEVKTTLSDKENAKTVSQSGDNDQAEASLHQKSNGDNQSQNTSVQETVNETKDFNRIPNGDIPNRNFSRSSLRKSIVPRSFLADSSYEIYNSKHNFETSNLTSETSEDMNNDKENVEVSPQEKTKKKKTVFSCLRCFPKRNDADCDGNYYRKIGENFDGN
jgi:hypothetical protein